jgi:ATP-dependent exoDNAse (exonuclease V) beta subunit
VGEDELREPQKSSLLRLLWPVVEPKFSEFNVAASQPQQTELPLLTAAPVLRRLVSGWQLPMPAATVAVATKVTATPDESLDPEYLWASESARHIGTVVHELLQRIAQDGAGQWGDARIESLRSYYQASLLRLGVAADELSTATQRVEHGLLQTLNDKHGRWLLDNTHQESLCEYAVSGVINGQLVRAVMDRTFVDAEGVRWIIDYKTSSHEGGDMEEFIASEEQRYRPQLERYAQLMALEDNRPIQLGIYFPLLQAWCSWSYRKTAE